MRRLIMCGFMSLAMAFVVTGCGKSQEQQRAEEAAKSAQQGAQQFAQGMEQLAKGLGQMAQGADGKTVKPVAFEQLEGVLPSPGGWKKGEVEGTSVSMPIPTANTKVTYTKGETEIDLDITDTALNQMLIAPFSMYLAAGYETRTSTGYTKGMSLGGQPGYEEWDGENKSGEITVLVGKRFVVRGQGSHLDGMDTLRKVVEQTNFKKLADLQ